MIPSDFLELFGYGKAFFKTIDDSEKKAFRLSKQSYGTFEDREKWLRWLNSEGAGIYFTVNNTDGKARKAENIKKVTAYFLDLDGTPMPKQLPLEPTVIVESSPNKYHCYWIIDNAPLAMFGHVQNYLAEKYKSDPKVKDLPRIMRLPGFYHCKSKPFLTRVIDCTGLLYTHIEFLKAFNVPALPFAKKRYLKQKPEFLNGGSIEGNVKSILKAPIGARNEVLFKNAAAVSIDIEAKRIEKDEAFSLLYSAGLQIGLQDFEVKRTIQSAWSYRNV